MSNQGAKGLLWIDLETTGLSEVYDEIIEIGAIYTDFNLIPLGPNFTVVIEPGEYAIGRLMMEPAVRNMHTENGLLEDIFARKCVKSIEEAETKLINWLDLIINRSSRKGPMEKFRFILAGSGVGHFDRRFIQAYMKRLDKMLAHAPLDVGDVRRLAKLAGFEPSSVPSQDTKTHRAADDILQHLQEAQVYFDLFKQLASMQEHSVTTEVGGR